jgi:hypothetical protein
MPMNRTMIRKGMFLTGASPAPPGYLAHARAEARAAERLEELAEQRRELHARMEALQAKVEAIKASR